MQKSGENSQITNRHFKRWFRLGIVVLATTIAGHDANSATNIDWNPMNKLGYFSQSTTEATPDSEIMQKNTTSNKNDNAGKTIDPTPSEPATRTDWNPINKLGYYAKPDTGPAIPLAYDDEINDPKPATDMPNSASPSEPATSID